MPAITLKNRNCSSEFLDGGQYSINGILRYEQIFGHTFVSTGGLETTQEFCSCLKLKPGMRVLDIGCGTGGSAFYLARKFGVEVLGIDLSTNMLEIANRHRNEMEDKVKNLVTFRKLDATVAFFPHNYFDLMYSRDAIMHIADKDLLYSKVYDWLKPGGQILVSEYIHGTNYPNHSREYLDYVKDRGYQLATLKNYENVLRNSGFESVVAESKTDYFVQILKKEMAKFKTSKKDFIAQFSIKDYQDLMDGWEIKVDRCNSGEQGWGLFKASKSLSLSS